MEPPRVIHFALVDMVLRNSLPNINDYDKVIIFIPYHRSSLCVEEYRDSLEIIYCKNTTSDILYTIGALDNDPHICAKFTIFTKSQCVQDLGDVGTDVEYLD